MFCSLLAEHIGARRMHFLCKSLWMIFDQFYGHFLDTVWTCFWTCFWTFLLFKRMKLHNWSNIKCSVPCWQSTSGQEECTFRAKVYGVMGTFSNQPCAADKCQEKAKKVGDWKTRFRNDCYMCSTSCVGFRLNYVICLKLLLLQL